MIFFSFSFFVINLFCAIALSSLCNTFTLTLSHKLGDELGSFKILTFALTHSFLLKKPFAYKFSISSIALVLFDFFLVIYFDEANLI